MKRSWLIPLLLAAVLCSAIAVSACKSDATAASSTPTSGSGPTVTNADGTVVTNPDGTAVTTTGGTPDTAAGQTTDTTAGGPKYYSLLTGEPVASEADLTKPVTGFMIDNHTAARPQSGIKQGEVIIEAIAEAGITRFLVLYQQHQPALVGPVRSLRVYDIDWAVPFDCSIGHVGGAESALKEVRNGKYRDIDMFRNGAYYWRSDDRLAPHNVYISYEKFSKLNLKKGYTSSDPKGFPRVDGSPVATPDAATVNVHLAGGAHDSRYEYDKTTNTYRRYNRDTLFVDREEGPVTPSVVIAFMVDEGKGKVEDGIVRERIATIGSGRAYIFQNGTVIQCEWHKETQAKQLSFTDASGNPVSLVRGQTWIVAVPRAYGKVTWS